MKTVTRTCQTVDVPLPPGQGTLRVAVTSGKDGEPEALVLATGQGGGDTEEPFRRPGWGSAPLTLPASVLPELRDALDALKDGQTDGTD